MPCKRSSQLSYTPIECSACLQPLLKRTAKIGASLLPTKRLPHIVWASKGGQCQSAQRHIDCQKHVLYTCCWLGLPKGNHPSSAFAFTQSFWTINHTTPQTPTAARANPPWRQSNPHRRRTPSRSPPPTHTGVRNCRRPQWPANQS